MPKATSRCGCHLALPTASWCSARAPMCSTRPPTTTLRSTSGRSAGTTRRSPSTGSARTGPGRASPRSPRRIARHRPSPARPHRIRVIGRTSPDHLGADSFQRFSPTMPSHHHQAIAQAMDLESLQAWKVFSLAFWEEPDHGLDGERQGELFHAGFLRSRWALYDLQEHGVESYLSDYQALCLQAVNAKYQAVLADPALAEMADEHLLHVLLVRDPQEWQPELAAITLVLGRRCPRRGRLVQRVEEGAVSASIDPASGLITGCHLLDDAGQLARVIRHPDNEASLLGQRLPAWEQAREALLRFFDESSYLRYCHLTFVITEQGLGFVAVEADQLAAHQMHQPLLDNASIDHYLKRLTD